MKSYCLFITALMVLTNAYAQTPEEAKKIVEKIYGLPDGQLYTSGNLAELGRLVTSKDKAFSLYFPDGNRVDSAVGKKDEMKRSSAFIVARVIIDEEIVPELNSGKELFYRVPNDLGGILLTRDVNTALTLKPNWKKIEHKIKKKYGTEHALRAIRWAQMDFYRVVKNFDKLTESYLAYVEKFSTRVYDLENSIAWSDIFERLENKKLLSKVANTYMGLLIRSGQVKYDANLIDTYANLLYKSGKIHEAITWQKMAIEMEKKEQWKAELLKNLKKMEQGQPTWPEK